MTSLKVSDISPNLVRLSILGFITYDPEDDEVHVNEKLFTYIAARAAHIDYDVIQFDKNVPPTNDFIFGV